MIETFRVGTRVRLAVVLFFVLGSVRLGWSEPPAGKRPLTHADYDSWKSITSVQLSPDGRYLAYAIVPQEGDGEVIARNTITGVEWRYGRGSQGQPNAAIARTGRRSGAAPASTRLAFTADNRRLVFSIAPTRGDAEKARKAKKKPEEMPKNALGIMDLTNGQVTRIDGVRSFQLPEENGRWLVFQKEPKQATPSSAARPERPARTPGARLRGLTPPGSERAPVVGSDLVLLDLQTRVTRLFSDVTEFSFTKDGQTLVYSVATKDGRGDGVYAVRPSGNATPLPLVAGKGKYSRLTWDEKQTRLAFLAGPNDTTSASAHRRLFCWDRKNEAVAERGMARISLLALLSGPAFTGSILLTPVPSAVRLAQAPPAKQLVGDGTSGLRPGWVVNERGPVSFSASGECIFFGVAPRKAPAPKKDDAAAGKDKVVVDLWHWKDDFIQPMQKVRAEQERNRSYRAVYHVGTKKFCQLGDETLATVTPSQEGRWSLGFDDRSYRRLVGFDGNYLDAYLVDNVSGARKLIRRKHEGSVTWSPGGTCGLFFDGKNWNTVRASDGKVTNLTHKLPVKFAVEDHDTPNAAPPYGFGGWTVGDTDVLLYDHYDIWQFAVDGSKARNLTAGHGRQNHIQFRYLSLDPKEKAVDPAKPLFLRAENQQTHDTGFFRLRLGATAPEMLIMAAKSFGTPIKAKNTDMLAMTVSTFYDFPDVYLADSEFRNLRKVTNANPQKAGLVWGKAELIPYRNLDGVPLQGMLIKPENFDPAKKYPLMVYIYERLSQNLHRFVDPRPGTSINPSYYASNGYLVLMPDIVYTVGQPGQSALKCVLPAIQAVVDRGCVDEKAIGIQGHSWGGYEIAYMITQTNRFKAVAAGAPVANMTSAYDGIRWGSGLPRQFQYEHTQSRIGGSLWQYPMRFVENSPLFMADRVHTPLLMLHNDQDDAVPWYQGIEYFLALRRLGKEVYMFNYNGEPHGLRKRINQKDYTVRLQQYFDHFLKGKPKPAWMEKGIPYLERDRG